MIMLDTVRKRILKLQLHITEHWEVDMRNLEVLTIWFKPWIPHHDFNKIIKSKKNNTTPQDIALKNILFVFWH